MSEQIKEINKTHLKQALNLVNAVFSKFVAVDYSEQGKATFENYLQNKYGEIFADLQTGQKKMWAYFRDEEILGVISTKSVAICRRCIRTSGICDNRRAARKRRHNLYPDGASAINNCNLKRRGL